MKTAREIKLKAASVISEIKKKEEYLFLCYKAGICPTCGETLTLKETTHTVHTKPVYIFGLKIKEGKEQKNSYTEIICKNLHKLTSPYNSDHTMEDPGFGIWSTTLNEEISNYHDRHYGGDCDGDGIGW